MGYNYGWLKKSIVEKKYFYFLEYFIQKQEKKFGQIHMYGEDLGDLTTFH
jgi:hypothetical protein